MRSLQKKPWLKHLLMTTALCWGFPIQANAASTLIIAQQTPSPQTVASGANVELAVQFAASVEAAQSVVVWVKLPDHATPSVVYPTANHPDAPYLGQNDEPTFVSATSSGQFTSSEIVISGVMIPARSVYWKINSIPSSSNFIVRTTLRTKPGTLQGTLLKTTAFASASNAASVQSVERTTTVTASSEAALQNTLNAGIYSISNQDFTQPGSANTLGFQLNIPDGSGKATLYQPTIYEDLSALVPFIDDGGDGLDASDFTNITSGGAFQSNFIPPLGGAVRPAIVWLPPSLDPGNATAGTFQFQLKNEASLPPGSTQYTRSVVVESPQVSRQTSSASINFPLPETINLTTAIGERIRGESSLTGDQDHALLSLGNDEHYQILLQANNGSAIALEDVVVFFKIPANSLFVSAFLPEDANGTLFYSTTTESGFTPTNPPPVDPSRAPSNFDFEDGTFWQNLTTLPPTNRISVTWVAVHIPHLSSKFFPLGPPSTVQPEITLQANLPDPCANEIISSSSVVRVYRKTLLNGQQVDAGPVQIPSEIELTTALSTKPTISGTASFSSSNLMPGTEFEFRLPLTNSNATSSANLTASQLRLEWPAIPVNGVPIFFELLETSPAAILSGNPALGDVTIDFGSLLKGASRTFTARFKAPEAGIKNGTTFQATATLSWSDVCQPTSFTASKTAAFLSNPSLSVVLNPIAAHTPPGGLINYVAAISNQGSAPTTDTFVIVPVPPKTVFSNINHPANGTPIRFSNVSYPAFNHPSYPVNTPTFILANFTIGNPSDNDTPGDPSDDFWTSPFGEATTTIAFPMDDPTVNLVPAPSGPRSISWQLLNDEDPGAAQLNSPLETLITAEIGILSSELLRATSNSQATIIRSTSSPEFLFFDGPNDTSPTLTDGQLTLVNFGTTLVNEPLSRTFTVKNTGVDSLTFSNITLPTGFSVVGPPLTGTTIAPGLTAQIEIALNVNSESNSNGSIRFFRFSGDTNPFDFPISGIVQFPPGPDFQIAAPGALITPLSLNQFPGEIEFTMPVQNLSDAGLATTSTASLFWPFISVNGVTQPAELISVSPSTIISDFREFGTIDIDFGALAPGETRTFSARFRIPQGTKPQTFSVSASVSSSTPAGFAFASDFAEALLVGSPSVQVTLPALLPKTPSGSEIDFTIQFQNAGDASLDLLGALMPVPSHIVMDRAYGSAIGNIVYFSDQPVPPLDTTPTNINNFLSSLVPGAPNDNNTPDATDDDYWTSPFGESTTACFFQTPETLASPSGTTELRWKGRNDDDPGPELQPSPHGTVLSAQALLLASSDELLTFLSNSIATTIGENLPPVWNGYQITVSKNQPVTVALAQLLARGIDPEGDPLTLTLPNPTSSAGGTLEFGPEGFTYTPPFDFTGPDELDLILSDGEFLVTALLTVQVIPAGDSGTPSANLVSFEIEEEQAVGVFAGIPGRSYLVQRSTDLILWSPLETVTAASDGTILFIDPTPPIPKAFYRTITLP